MLEVEGVDVIVGERRILTNVSLHVQDSRVVAIVGPNGAGKTTLLDVISGSVKPAHGSVRTGSIGRVHQGSPLPSTLTVAEIALLATGRRKAAMSLIGKFGLANHASSFASEISTGMRRILDLGIATASSPEALLLDEPSTGLARSEVVHLAELIKRLRAETGCSIVLVEHDAWLVEEVADEVIVLERGAIVARGPVAQIFAASSAPRARSTN
ncbi:MAG: ATP-binding cassette domain-containing protein [Actinomycetota bacterium]